MKHLAISLSDEQVEKLDAYTEALRQINQRINLISRDTEALIAERHVRHCLALAWRQFSSGSVIVDWGTGGGLPAIPLAICFPEVEVHAIDSVGKKIRAVQTMARRLGLGNVSAWHGRAEAWTGHAHYSVSRATAPLVDLWGWHVRAAVPFEGNTADGWTPGLICLKGGDLTDEIETLTTAYPGLSVAIHPLEPLLERPYFSDKVIVHVTRSIHLAPSTDRT